MTHAARQILAGLEDAELVLAADQIFLDLDRCEELGWLLGGSDERLAP